MQGLSGEKGTNVPVMFIPVHVATVCILSTQSLKPTQGMCTITPACTGQLALSLVFPGSIFWSHAIQKCFCVLQTIKIWSEGRQGYWLLEDPLTNLLSI